MTRKQTFCGLPAALLVCALLAVSAHAGAKASAAPEFHTDKEALGTLHLGMAEAKVLAAVPCAPVKLKEAYEGATGEYAQTWRFDGCGLELKMVSARRGGAKKVAAITVSAPSALATKKGIRVGSTEQEVLAAYGRFRDADEASSKGVRFVAGSIFDGMIFSFEKGRVTQIFLGAAAE